MIKLFPITSIEYQTDQHRQYPIAQYIPGRCIHMRKETDSLHSRCPGKGVLTLPMHIIIF